MNVLTLKEIAISFKMSAAHFLEVKKKKKTKIHTCTTHFISTPQQFERKFKRSQAFLSHTSFYRLLKIEKKVKNASFS